MNVIDYILWFFFSSKYLLHSILCILMPFFLSFVIQIFGWSDKKKIWSNIIKQVLKKKIWKGRKPDEEGGNVHCNWGRKYNFGKREIFQSFTVDSIEESGYYEYIVHM